MNTEEKRQRMSELVQRMRGDTAVENITVMRKGKSANVGLVNHFRKHELIPNKWFDWERRVDAPIMIIGQDWGPYNILRKYFTDYERERNEPSFNYDRFLFQSFSSRTEKFIVKAVEENYLKEFGNAIGQDVWSKVVFTMAVLFTRQGNHFRGNEFFDEKQSAALSFQYVKEQIEIIQPRIIVPLGNLAWTTVTKVFEIAEKRETITDVVARLQPKSYFTVNGTHILPNFHPAAHVDPSIQMNVWKKFWPLFKTLV